MSPLGTGTWKLENATSRVVPNYTFNRYVRCVDDTIATATFACFFNCVSHRGRDQNRTDVRDFAKGLPNHSVTRPEAP
jgi:hypothetical protein